jgi:arylsulfatase A-like enzyme
MPAPTDRPNVLFVLSDQQRWDTVGANGCPMDLTPNLDALAARGVRFANAITCQPVCAPARAVLQTGKYATSAGVWRNGFRLPAEERTLAHHFKAHGYEVGYVGKWHLADTRDRPIPPDRRGGYDDYWVAADLLEFTSHPYDTRLFDEREQEVYVEGYRVDATTDLAMRFLARERDRPFYLFISYLEPHHQNDENAFVGPKEYDATYANPWVPEDLHGRPGDWPSQLTGYYGAIRRIDDCLGKMLAHLEARGQLENTVVFFTSDHGCHFRTRNAEYKRSCHESSVHIPAVMAGPGLPRGRVVEPPVSLIDFPPTVLDAAGIAVPEAMQGRSTLPLVEDPTADWPAEVFIQISEAEVGRALRTAHWKYAVYAPDKDPVRDSASDVYQERYLYDLRADPHEKVNLIGRPDRADVATRLRARLEARIAHAEHRSAEIVPARYHA